MNDKRYYLNTFLAAVVGVAVLAAVVVRAVAPAVIIPELDIPNMVLLSLVALLLEHFVAPGAFRCYICIPVLAAVTFGLLPWAAGFTDLAEIWKYALAGGIVFTVTTFLFTSIQERIASGEPRKGAAIISALGLYLAAQCFMGLIL